MGIVHENANFHGSETDFARIKKKIVCRGKEIGCTKNKRKKEALVLRQIPAKHTKRINMQLSPVLVA